MNRRAAIRDLVFAAAGALFPPRLYGDVDVPDPLIRTDVHLVLLDVSVKDGGGRFVAGLGKGAFNVYENGVPQPVTVFADNDQPATVGILLDESRSMRPKRAEVLDAAEAFLALSNAHDEIFVLHFNDTVWRGLPDSVPFSNDTAQLRSALLRGEPEGRTALNDAIVDGLRHLDLGRRGKKALLVISDGGDNASAHKRSDVFDRVERSVATVYCVGLSDPESQERDPRMLKRLARISGGEAWFPEGPRGVRTACQDIANDIRKRYTLGYLPRPDNGRGSLRRIFVRVSAPDGARLTAHTRSGYRYEKGVR